MKGALKNIARFKLITFDMIGTLIKPRLGHLYLEMKMEDNLLSCMSANFADDFRKQCRRFRLAYPNYGVEAGLMWQQWYDLIITKMCKEMYDVHDEELIRCLTMVVIDIHKQSCTWSVVQDSVVLLRDLIKLPRKPSIGVISNFDPRTATILRAVNLHKYFNIFINSYEAGAEKPDRRIFDRALKTSCIFGIQPREALHIGADPVQDYFGARDAGWKALLISAKDPETITERYPFINRQHIFKSTRDLHECLKNGKLICY